MKEFRDRGYLPEALANYLALLGWSPGEGDELLPIDELARRFQLEKVGHSASVFDVEKLAWVNRHYLKLADRNRLAHLTVPYLRRAGWLTEPSTPALDYLASVVAPAAGSVDRLEQVPARLHFLFDYSPERALANPAIRAEAREPQARAVVAALAEALAGGVRMHDKEAFRATAGRVREKTGQKGKALFHPIRLALTGEPEGLELDVAVPAIERGADLPADAGIARIPGARERALSFLEASVQ